MVLKSKPYFSITLTVRDMQQMYDLWLSLTNQNRRSEGPMMTPPPEEKQNAMPVDYTESVVGNWPSHAFQCLIYNFDDSRDCTINVDLNCCKGL